MTAAALLAAQATLWTNIQARAVELGYDPAKVEPICDGTVVDIHDWRGKRLLWAPHPAARIPPEEWVDAVLAALRSGD